MQKQFVFFSGLFIMISIILGAMGAHTLKEILAPEEFSSFEVAVKYQGFLSMGVMILAINADRFNFPLTSILRAMLIGMILFCLSIYILITFKTIHWSTSVIGPITPIGGSVIIITWIVFLYRLIKN